MSVDEINRLGLAYCRLNTWEWDEIVGPKPDGFDEMPRYDKFWYIRTYHPIFMKFLEMLNPMKFAKKQTKYDCIYPVIEEIRSRIGEENCSRAWWANVLGKPHHEWQAWYYGHH